MIYKAITKEGPKHCPGGVCEVQQKEPIQMFNTTQKFIAGATFVALISGIYLFLVKTESKTFFGAFLHDALLTKEQLQKEKDEAYQKALAKEFGDDEDF